MDLYRDCFMVIAINDTEHKGIYADALLDYIEFSEEVARFIAKKCAENLKHGYKLIDFILKIRK